mgnify:CR=1 FL=1
MLSLPVLIFLVFPCFGMNLPVFGRIQIILCVFLTPFLGRILPVDSCFAEELLLLRFDFNFEPGVASLSRRCLVGPELSIIDIRTTTDYEF